MIYWLRGTAMGKGSALLLLIYALGFMKKQAELQEVLGLHREYPRSSHLMIEWEAAGNISKCKLTFNYTKISFR